MSPGAVGGRCAHRRADRLLYEPPGGAGLVREARRPEPVPVKRFAAAGPHGSARRRRSVMAGRARRGSHAGTSTVRRRLTTALRWRSPPMVAGAPHESPPVMTIPLIILAVGATLGFLVNAPFGGLNFLQKWLAPVFPATIAPAVNVATGTKWVLGVIVTAVAFLGLFLGLTAWRKVERPELEPAVLVHGWYIDEAVAALVSGPLATMAAALGFGVDVAPEHRRRGQRRIAAHRPDGPPVAALADRLRAQLRPRHRVRCRDHPGVRGDASGELNGVTSSLPILTIIVFLPLVGAAFIIALLPASAGEETVAQPGRHSDRSPGGAGSWSSFSWSTSQQATPGHLRVREQALLDKQFRHLLERRRGRDFVVPRRRGRAALPGDSHGQAPTITG